MSAENASKNYIIEKFEPDKHDRSAFSCGVLQVDNYFKNTANKLNKAGNVRLYVMTTFEDEVAGFYAINAHSVRYNELPKKYSRTRPSHGNIPAAFISMIGRDERFMGQGIGGHLLVDALHRILLAANHLGIAVIMLDVLDCGNEVKTESRKALYESYGFIPLEVESLRMYISIETVSQMMENEQTR